MKLGLIFAAATTICIATAFAAFASEPTPVAQHSAPVPAVDGASQSSVLQLPEIVFMPEVTVVGQAPARRIAAPQKPKQFVCGPVYDNAVGGRNSDCFWR